jgi:hypothetical protein
MIVHVKVVGMVAGGRQHVVAHTRESDPVLLLPEPDNPYDSHAIAVHTAPRAVLVGEVVSSIKDPAHVGSLDDEDRQLLADRQAGYLPRDVAARLTLPPTGVVGYVSRVRWAPPEYDATGNEREPRVAGFDVAFWRATTAAEAAVGASIDDELETT